MVFDRKNIVLNPADSYSRYCLAHAVTNEDLRFVNSVCNPRDAKVLTVAASGDQPISFAMNGAQSVNTFDITFAAKVIMDIKCAALKQLGHNKYLCLVYQLCDGQNNIDELVSKYDLVLPDDTNQFIELTKGQNLIWNKIYRASPLPNSNEYEKMHASVVSPFNFIWSDLGKLSGELHGKYDIIYLSNIPQCSEDRKNTIRIIRNLTKHLHQNGKIVINSLATRSSMDNCRKTVKEVIHNAEDFCNARCEEQQGCILTLFYKLPQARR